MVCCWICILRGYYLWVLNCKCLQVLMDHPFVLDSIWKIGLLVPGGGGIG